MKCTCGFSIGHPLVKKCTCKPLELTDAEIIDCLTAWAKEKYGDIYLPPSEHQTANAIEMARAVLEYAQKK